MNLSEIISAIQSSSLTQINSPIKLRWGSQNKALGQALLPQRIDIREGMFTGIEGHITCLATRSDLPLNSFIGMPISVQLVTDLGNLHSINAIVTDVRSGESDGSLASYQITVRDALSIMDGRVNTRVFRAKSVPEILGVLFSEWRSRSTTIASAFDFDLSGLSSDNHPKRECTQQLNESDRHFVERLCRREGISWYIAAGARDQGTANASTGSSPVHTLVLFDSNATLKQGSVAEVRYHRNAATEERDAITQFSLSQKLIPAAVDNGSWCGKDVRMSRVERPTTIDQGTTGNDLAKLLTNRLWDAPHAGDSNAHLTRMTDARIAALEFESMLASGTSSVRDLTVGTWFKMVGHPDLTSLDAKKKLFVVVSVHHKGENNLPKELNEKAQALFKATGWASPLGGDSGAKSSTRVSSTQSVETRYENHFTAVQLDVPIRPSFIPEVHLPRVYPLTAIVVGPEGEEVHTDALGRIKVQLQGLDSADHEHASGAGTSGTDIDSAWVRASGALAGDRFGNTPLYRVGTEVVIDFLNGDPDKMFIAGVMANGRNAPAAFSHVGSLPGNRYVSGTKTKEISGQRYNQLRFDDTHEQISTQLASEHAHTQLNMGYLTHPRTDGAGDARGEGAELRTDAAAAIRAANGVLISTHARAQANGTHLDRTELIELMTLTANLAKQLSSYAAQHGGAAHDLSGQDALVKSVSEWDSASTASGNAVLATDSLDGTVHATPKSHAVHAGENIDHVAQANFQVTSGQSLNMVAGKGASVFANSGGVKAIANQGPVTIQAQSDTLEVASEKALRIASNSDEITVSGKTIKLIADDGSYIIIGDGVTIGTKMGVIVKASEHSFEGPTHLSREMNQWSSAGYDQRVRMMMRDGSPAANQKYEIRRTDGAVISGVTDGGGWAQIQKGVKMEGASIVWKGKA
ncbi:type VI secretion system Vgr family protein [Robbsia andropogonis]|uniref:type VI secretion system Vgr family protein n=1 Tax=Robbsia andropogonis TaxID=28092 RepID=UPI003D1DABD5